MKRYAKLASISKFGYVSTDDDEIPHENQDQAAETPISEIEIASTAKQPSTSVSQDERQTTKRPSVLKNEGNEKMRLSNSTSIASSLAVNEKQRSFDHLKPFDESASQFNLSTLDIALKKSPQPLRKSLLPFCVPLQKRCKHKVYKIKSYDQKKEEAKAFRELAAARKREFIKKLDSKGRKGIHERAVSGSIDTAVNRETEKNGQQKTFATEQEYLEFKTRYMFDDAPKGSTKIAAHGKLQEETKKGHSRLDQKIKMKDASEKNREKVRAIIAGQANQQGTVSLIARDFELSFMHGRTDKDALWEPVPESYPTDAYIEDGEGRRRSMYPRKSIFSFEVTDTDAARSRSPSLYDQGSNTGSKSRQANTATPDIVVFQPRRISRLSFSITAENGRHSRKQSTAKQPEDDPLAVRFNEGHHEPAPGANKQQSNVKNSSLKKPEESKQGTTKPRKSVSLSDTPKAPNLAILGPQTALKMDELAHDEPEIDPKEREERLKEEQKRNEARAAEIVHKSLANSRRGTIYKSLLGEYANIGASAAPDNGRSVEKTSTSDSNEPGEASTEPPYFESSSVSGNSVVEEAIQFLKANTENKCGDEDISSRDDVSDKGVEDGDETGRYRLRTEVQKMKIHNVNDMVEMTVNPDYPTNVRYPKDGKQLQWSHLNIQAVSEFAHTIVPTKLKCAVASAAEYSSSDKIPLGVAHHITECVIGLSDHEKARNKVEEDLKKVNVPIYQDFWAFGYEVQK